MIYHIFSYLNDNDNQTNYCWHQLLYGRLPGVLVPRHHCVPGQVCVRVPPGRSFPGQLGRVTLVYKVSLVGVGVTFQISSIEHYRPWQTLDPDLRQICGRNHILRLFGLRLL